MIFPKFYGNFIKIKNADICRLEYQNRNACGTNQKSKTIEFAKDISLINFVFNKYN